VLNIFSSSVCSIALSHIYAEYIHPVKFSKSELPPRPFILPPIQVFDPLLTKGSVGPEVTFFCEKPTPGSPT
jgi:hypothetical protein